MRDRQTGVPDPRWHSGDADRRSPAAWRRVPVATDAQEIASACRAHGIDALLTAPDHPSGTDRLGEVARALNLPDDAIVVNVQGDEPLIDPALVAAVAAELTAHPDCAIATAAAQIHDADEIFNPNAVKVVTDAAGRALLFSRAPLPWCRDAWADGRGTAANTPPPAALPMPVLRHIGLYAYRAGFLRQWANLAPAPLEQTESLEQLRALWHGFRIAVMVTPEAPPAGVDTPADLERVRAVWKQSMA